jgi:hypothetical protein
MGLILSQVTQVFVLISFFFKIILILSYHPTNVMQNGNLREVEIKTYQRLQNSMQYKILLYAVKYIYIYIYRERERKLIKIRYTNSLQTSRVTCVSVTIDGVSTGDWIYRPL